MGAEDGKRFVFIRKKKKSALLKQLITANSYHF